MPKLTRNQLHALSLLHMRGELSGQGRGIGLPGPRQATLNALVTAGVARRADADGRRFLPVLHAYADAFGTWHVEIPDMLPISTDQYAAVARAVIAGEVWQRNRQSYVDDWRPRVEYVSRAARYRSARTNELIRTYREV